jgi:hypothetical protein
MATSAKRLAAMAEQSAFVFVGEVSSLASATMAELAADNTATVRVLRVLTAPPAFADLAGHDITVRTSGRVTLKRNDRRTFYANGWVFGSSLAVDVVGAVPETDGPHLTASLRATASNASDSILKARLESATLGVAGTVADVSRQEHPPTHISEHDPDWHEATIDVDEVIKGSKRTKQVKVLFPQSDDVRWHDVSKLVPGQQGVFMLHGPSKRSSEGVPARLLAAVPKQADVLTTLHAYDVLPIDELERVRALAREQRRRR